MNKWKSYAGVILLLTIAIGIILNPMMPAQMASHWNLGGQINGYMSKFWGLFLAPFLMAIFILLFSVLPQIDPLIKDRSEKNELVAYFDKFTFMFVVFLFYLYVIGIGANLNIIYEWGLKLNIGQFVMPGIGILFFFIGIFLFNIRRNWFAGFRTPWTIDSPEIWEKTHHLGGMLFILTGALVAFSFLWIKIAAWIFFGVILIDVLVPVGYSLYLYLEKKSQ